MIRPEVGSRERGRDQMHVRTQSILPIPNSVYCVHGAVLLVDSRTNTMNPLVSSFFLHELRDKYPLCRSTKWKQIWCNITYYLPTV